MKKILSVIFLLGFYFVGMTQCEETISGQSLKEGMFIICKTDDRPDKRYVSIVEKVDGNSFSCRFLHTNSIYEFVDMKLESQDSHFLMQSTVKSNIGGKYGTGTIFIMNVYMIDPEDCDLASSSSNSPYNIIATFEDNKKFLGRLQKTNEGYTIRFAHTDSVYMTDDNFRVLSQKGGGYSIGSQMKVVHARLLSFEN